VRRGAAVAVWVGPKSGDRKSPCLAKEAGYGAPGEKRGTRTADESTSLRAAARRTRYGMGMDISWLNDARDRRTDRIGVGGGIWHAENMAKVAEAGVTHIINMQIEVEDEVTLAAAHNIEALWNGTHDDFEPKPASLFQCGVEFALEALDKPDSKLLIHCAAGVHRAPMMALAVLGSMGWNLEDAMQLIEDKRSVVDFAEVYVESVERFLRERVKPLR